MKIGVVQLNSSDNPLENLDNTKSLISDAADAGCDLICTPEVTNCVSTSRQWQSDVLSHQDEDVTLKTLCEIAAQRNTWINIGSLAVTSGDTDGRFVNRSFMIDPNGSIAATYDKIHMFDVQLSETETYFESSGYRAGIQATLCNVGDVLVGMSICYDVRFPHLYRGLAKSGAQILLVPSAFSVPTGQAHWEVLLRARAIETGCFVIAAAQTGTHHSRENKTRETYGHSLVISPWGEVLLDAGRDVGVSIVDFDLQEVAKARKRIPALTHDVSIEGL